MNFLQPSLVDSNTVWARARAEELGYTSGDKGVTSQQILAEMAAEDFDEPELPDQLQAHTEFLMRAYIKEKTRTAHVRIAKAFIAFQVARDPSFRPEVVDDQTPQRINQFITFKRGLPTRSRAVAEFMVGLEKTKAAAGEVLQSARALTLDDMHRLFDLCIVQPHQSKKQDALASQRKGVIRYTAYLLAWLLVLQMSEAESSQ
ncbi:uncharacterized protein SCHCODRAFT_02665263 [Schizophyllum commune H4-8]|nr:uncharacterized protein SCHCODRAFT_02665263 [Schizophyllum commune H4-8]KAI5894820.1 hypothetical protein SCHCODRAFT_02665263 [Schizophyllum commune H4-8]